MDSIETAIRNALEKGDAGDEAFRARIYRSALTALDRIIDNTPNLSPEAAKARRAALAERIAGIEAEFTPAVDPDAKAPAAGAAPPVAPQPRAVAAAGEHADGRGPSGPRVPEPRIEDDYSESQGYPDFEVVPNDGAPPYVESRAASRRRRPPAVAFLAVTALAIVGIGAWWVYQSGLLLSVEQRSSGIASPPPLQDSGAEAPKKEGEADAAQNWITVFSPAEDTASVGAAADAKVEMLNDGDVKFLRVRSGPSGAATTFTVGQGVLERIAGKHALFDIVARAEEGKDTQISVSCDFGALGTCERKRYLVTNQRNEFLFEMDVPDKRPAGAGTIAIDSDVGKQGKAVDILEIRVSVMQ